MDQTKYLAVAALCALSIAACSNSHRDGPEADAKRPAAPAANAASRTPVMAIEVSEEELVTWRDWMAEVFDQKRAAMSEAGRLTDDELKNEEAFRARFERIRREEAELMAREPFRGTIKAYAMTDVVQAVYATGTYSRNEEELDQVRYRHGKALVDSILEHDGEIEGSDVGAFERKA